MAKEKTPLPDLNRITVDPEVMGGKPCIRGLRVTVGTVVGPVAAGHSSVRSTSIGSYWKRAPSLPSRRLVSGLGSCLWRSGA